MSKVKIVLNKAGVRELLRSDEVGDYLEQLAQGIAQRAGDGYAVDRRLGKNRVNVRVKAETPEAKKADLEDNALLKAVGR